MTEDEKLDVYIDQTLQMDRSDPANAMRVHDITGAWKMRASEPAPLASGWRQTVAHVMQKLDLGVLTEEDTPTSATGRLDAALDTIQNAIAQANIQVQKLAMRDEIIRNQSNILDAFAMILKLEQGKLYMDMVPMLRAIVEPSAEEPMSAQLIGPDNTPVQ